MSLFSCVFLPRSFVRVLALRLGYTFVHPCRVPFQDRLAVLRLDQNGCTDSSFPGVRLRVPEPRQMHAEHADD